MGKMDSSSSSSDNDQENLTDKDILVLKNIDNVIAVMGKVSGSGDLKYSTDTASLSITGVDASIWKDVTTDEIDEGRHLMVSDTYSVVIGSSIVTNTFSDGIPLNSKVTIEGTSFKVVGILEDGTSGVYIPIDAARDVLEDVGEDDYDSISVKIEDVDIANETVNLIEEKLMLSRGILYEDDIDFTVTNPSAMQETMQETMSSMTLFLSAIAAISLLVGAIGIANTMFTSVLEKTKEIGIMKAIGAKNLDVMLIFLFNAGLIGFVGGLGGLVVGIFGSGLVGSMGSDGGMMRMMGSTSITPGLLIGALTFSVIIGMVAGAIPAWNASKMKPVDALRYE